MRYLFLTLGAPATGKSTFLREHGLEGYTVSTDVIRQLLSAPRQVVNAYGNVSQVISNTEDRDVWKLHYDIIERRMQNGDTTIADATHLFKGAFKTYLKLAQQYHYHLIVVDFMAELFEKHDEPTEIVTELVRRDHGRDNQIPDPVIIGRFVERYIRLKKSKFQSVKVISPEVFEKMLLPIEPISLDEFDKIKIIGDVHSDVTNLKRVFDDHIKGTAYIFVGDYLDRGTKNAETFDFLRKLKGKNLFFLRGNHEQSILAWSSRHFKKGQFGKGTLVELLKSGVTDDDLHQFTERLQDYLYFTYRKKTYFVSHAGIEPQRLHHINILANETEFAMGIGAVNQGPYLRDIDTIWENSDETTINVHGHRNNFRTPFTDMTKKSFNLTDDNDFRVLEIKAISETSSKLNAVAMRHVDWIFEKEIKHTSGGLVDKVMKDSDVASKNIVGTNLVVHNFKKKVFFDKTGKRWTPNTMSARGLFTSGDKIEGRGFTKFFNINETPESTLESLVFPVSVYEKFNGFLAITFYDQSSHQVRIFSKGGLTEHTALAEEAIIADHKEKQLRAFLTVNQSVSVLFEIITPLDTHIVDYGGETFAKAIAVIDNETGQPNEILEKEWSEISPIQLVDNLEDLRVLVAEHQSKIGAEGLVLRGQNKMLKMKSDDYSRKKEFRNRVNLLNRLGTTVFWARYQNDALWHWSGTRAAVEAYDKAGHPDLPELVLIDKFLTKGN